MPTVDEVYNTNAGAHLFNGITRMHLVDREGHRAYFSKRHELTRLMIGLLLEAGWLPENMTPRVRTDKA